jgi:hypothetical protein
MSAEGRRFAGLNAWTLKNRWLTALRNVRDGDGSQFADWDDAIAELLLRGLDPPYGSVKRSDGRNSGLRRPAEVFSNAVAQ